MAGEKTTSDVSKTPITAPKAPPIKAEAPSQVPPLKAEKGEKPAETQNVSEQKDAKPQKTDIDLKKEAIVSSKTELQKKQNAAQEVAEGKKVYKDELNFLESMDGPGLVPPRPDQKMVKKEDYERSQKELHEQENETAKAIEGKMNAELESVTKTGKIDQLAPEAQTKIRTEAVRVSLDPQKLPKSVLLAVKGANGKALFNDASFDDKGEIKPENITGYKRDLVLASDVVKDAASRAVDEYKKIQDEAKKTGKKPDPELVKKLQLQIGLPSPEALELSQLRSGMKLVDYPADTQIGIVQRVLSESTFGDLQSTLSDGLQWSHIPDMVKREIVLDSFQYDPLKNSKVVEQAISAAKTTATNGKKEGESDAQFASRLKEKVGVKGTDLQALSLEARKSGLSPGMRALADFFGPIGAALGMPFWQEYMGERRGSDDYTDNSSDRWTADSKGGKANISQGVVRSNKSYLDSGKGLKLEGGSYEQQASSASAAISANKERYMRVAEKTGVPWELIGAIHFRESSLDFNTCLHNGDPLGRKTTSVPAGRGPFSTWEESAVDALNMKGQLGFSQITQTNQLEQVAGYAEKYNGFGYRNKGVSSAYVWAGTEAYTGGMYVADHVFSRTKKDPRPGVMAIISKLVPPSVIAEKRTPDASSIAPTASSFGQEFTSSPFEKSSSGTTLCSRTGRNNLCKLLDRSEDVPAGNAIDVHGIYQSGTTFDGMVGGYNSSWSPPENANVADIFLKTSSPYGHRAVAYRGPQGWMILDPYYGGKGTAPQPLNQYPKKDAIAGVAFYQKNLANQNNAPNQAPKSDIGPQGPVKPSDTSGKTEGAQNEILKAKAGIGFVGDSHFNFLTGNLGYSPYGRSKKIPGESTVAIPTVMSGGNMGEKGYSVSQLITSPLGQEYLQGKKDIVVCLGTNDATMFRADQMVSNMTKIVSNIRAINPAGKIIVVTPPRNRSPLVNAKIAEYQEMLLAREGSLGIKVAPFYTYSQEQRLGLSDADHLNTAGYQAMKQYINSYI